MERALVCVGTRHPKLGFPNVPIWRIWGNFYETTYPFVPFPLVIILVIMRPDMPNLYFCQPHSQNQGMLRAVLSREDCKYLADPKQATYLGEQFPNLTQNPRDGRDFAVLKFAAEEAGGGWRSGFYRVDTDLMELNAVLLRLAR